MGVVDQVGSKSNLKPGQAVALFTNRGYSEYIVSEIQFKFEQIQFKFEQNQFKFEQKH